MKILKWLILCLVLLSLKQGVFADDLSASLPPAVKNQMLVIKGQNPEIYQELVPVVNQDADFRKDLSDRTVPFKLNEAEVPFLLFRGALFCHFDDAQLRKQFPKLCRVAGYIGISAQAGVPKVLSSFDPRQDPVKVLYSAAQPPGQDGYGIDGYDFEGLNDQQYHDPSVLTVQTIQGTDYLVATFYPRMSAYATDQIKAVEYFLIGSQSITYSKTEEFHIAAFPHGSHPKPLGSHYADFKPVQN